MAERRRDVVDYEAFQQQPSALFRDYLTGDAKATRFFAGSSRAIGAIAEAGERSLEYPRDRAAVTAVLVRQQRERGAEQAAAAAARLADPGAVAVVTGQQAVLFGGPLFVLYKALAVLRVAESLERERRAPVVPVFWVASDDHDFAEIRQATVLSAAGQLRSFRYEPRQEPLGQPASRIALDDTIRPLLGELLEALPAGESRERLSELLASSYAPGSSVAAAFARLLSGLLPELVVLDPADPEIKALMLPVLLRELREGSPSSRCAAAVGPELIAAGYHQQVPVREGFYNVFAIVDGERRALAARDGSIEVRGTSRTLAPDQASAMLEADASLWSPGALLRPLAQDHLLPTAAYIGGPAEIAYHAQIGPSYSHFGIPRPVLLPRPSATLVEAAQARAMETEGLSLSDLEGDPEGIVARWARESYPDVETAFGAAREAIEDRLEGVADTLAAIDPTLRGAAESARGRALHQLETLHEKSIRALKKRDRTRAERLRRTRDALFPGGSLQERGIGLVTPLARHGEPLIGEIRERLDPWATGHQVLFI
jgi:bacillithiol biosynthesis cysteine-adding enzyme BshC